MREIKLEFMSGEERNTLLADPDFANEIAYLNPIAIDPNGLILTDPVEQHFSLDTEVVVLTLFARAFKRLMFPATSHHIEFLAPFANQSKMGLKHDRQILISGNQRQL